MKEKAVLIQKQLDTPLGSIAYWVSRTKNECGINLVFLPGLTADHRFFKKQTEYFQGKYNLLVWDAPGHYKSRPFQLNYSLEDKAKWLHDILEEEGFEKPVLVGQSMGGYVSQAYMELFPGNAGGFVSIDSAPLKRIYYPGWEIWFLKHTYLMYMSIPWKLLIRWGSRGTAQTEYGRGLMHEVMSGYDKKYYCELAAHGYRILAEAIEKNRPYEIDCPAILICGTRDRAGDVKKFNRMWAEREGLEIVWLDGAGHNSNNDMPAEVNETIERLI